MVTNDGRFDTEIDIRLGKKAKHLQDLVQFGQAISIVSTEVKIRLYMKYYPLDTSPLY